MTCFNCAWFPDKNTSQELCSNCKFCMKLMVENNIASCEELAMFVALAKVKKE